MSHWRTILSAVIPEPVFLPSATEEEVAQLAHDLQVHLPEDLRAVFLETNGVDNARYHFAELWSTQKMREENAAYQAHVGDWGEAFAPLVFFTDAGNGDNFGFMRSATDGRTLSAEVYVWDHEEDAIRLIAPTFQAFVEGWFSGALKI